jgi:hypothetical protein
MLKYKLEVLAMNKSVTVEMDDITEEQAKAEIERIKIEMQLLFDQMKHDREEGRRIDARIDANMADIRAILERLQASR